MKSLVILLGLVALAYGKAVDSFLPEHNPVFGYLTKYGIPRYEEILRAEKKYLSKNGERVINGSPAASQQFPFQAGLMTDIIGIDDGRRGVCGGFVLSPSVVGTAAHCWYDGLNQAWRATVFLGSPMLNDVYATTRQTDQVVTHPNWFPNLVRNDVAVIILPEPVVFNANIAPIALPSGRELNENFVGESSTVVGFGLTENDGSVSQQLNYVQLPIISNAECRSSVWTYLILLQNSNICTSGANGNGPCHGDSGGPLYITRNGKDILIGVVSFGSPNGCESSDPAAYARTTSFIDFFNKYV